LCVIDLTIWAAAPNHRLLATCRQAIFVFGRWFVSPGFSFQCRNWCPMVFTKGSHLLGTPCGTSTRIFVSTMKKAKFAYYFTRNVTWLEKDIVRLAPIFGCTIEGHFLASVALSLD
jgi:hypothetical protein